jgi:hypothetical protein
MKPSKIYGNMADHFDFLLHHFTAFSVSALCIVGEDTWTESVIVIFEVFTAVIMKNGVSWNVTPCGTCKSRRFGGT